MTTRHTLAMILSAAAAGSCVSDRTVATSPAPMPATIFVAATPDVVIVRLVGRRNTVTILAGTNGPQYSVTDPAGRTVVSRASLQELRTLHPEAYRLVQPDVTAYAGL